ncbi:hypothetical protein HYV86_01775 [Candidatus Woesearchaeota archaeon]|nr:hypothetical protein [Candidatus Woesearchaeota archaeon]
MPQQTIDTILENPLLDGSDPSMILIDPVLNPFTWEATSYGIDPVRLVFDSFYSQLETENATADTLVGAVRQLYLHAPQLLHNTRAGVEAIGQVVEYLQPIIRAVRHQAVDKVVASTYFNELAVQLQFEARETVLKTDVALEALSILGTYIQNPVSQREIYNVMMDRLDFVAPVPFESITLKPTGSSEIFPTPSMNTSYLQAARQHPVVYGHVA